MDELFTLPSTSVAMPRAYWLGFDKRELTSAILVIRPSEFEYHRVAKAVAAAKSDEYDMEVMNQLYRDSAMVLPHRPYLMITSELYELDHARYLGNDEEVWDPDLAIGELKLIHFSDWPVPKVSTDSFAVFITTQWSALWVSLSINLILVGLLDSGTWFHWSVVFRCSENPII